MLPRKRRLQFHKNNYSLKYLSVRQTYLVTFCSLLMSIIILGSKSCSMESLQSFQSISEIMGKNSFSRGKQFPLRQQGVWITLINLTGWGEVESLRGKIKKSHQSWKEVWLSIRQPLEKILLVVEISSVAFSWSLWLKGWVITNLITCKKF